MIGSLSEATVTELSPVHGTMHQAWTRLGKESKHCHVPAAMDPPKIPKDRRPVCLVTFGNPEDEAKHPAPDPLLLALRAANIWGKLTDFALLANGSSEDADISEDDMIAEAAYYEAKFGLSQDLAWEELAQKLGQPNGHVG